MARDNKAPPLQANEETRKAHLTYVALEKIHQRKVARLSGVLLVISLAASAYWWEAAGKTIGITGVLCAMMLFGASSKMRAMSQSMYYSIPGSTNHKGKHVCIYCGQWGIHRHTQYKTTTTHADCSKCGANLWVE